MNHKVILHKTFVPNKGLNITFDKMLYYGVYNSLEKQQETDY